jgi:phi LC3 family holin
MKAKLKNCGFWVALTSAVLLLVQATASAIGYELPVDFSAKAHALVNGVLGVLTVLGVVSNPKEGKWFTDTEE